MARILRILLALISLPLFGDAFPIGAGDCPEGRAAVGSVHLTANTVTTGLLEDFNLRVEINGMALDPGSTNSITLQTGVEHTWRVADASSRNSNSEAVGFRGFLLRLGGGIGETTNTGNDDGIDTRLALSSAESNVKEAFAACVLSQGVGGVTHNNSELKTSISGILRLDETATDLQLDVTIVVENRNSNSVYFYSAYRLAFQVVDDEVEDEVEGEDGDGDGDSNKEGEDNNEEYWNVGESEGEDNDNDNDKEDEGEVNNNEDYWNVGALTREPAVETPPDEMQAAITTDNPTENTILTDSPTEQPSASTSSPTSIPITIAPTSSPTSIPATNVPTEQLFTSIPATDIPTSGPIITTTRPTEEPVDSANDENNDKDDKDDKEVSDTDTDTDIDIDLAEEQEQPQEKQLTMVLGRCSRGRPCGMCEGDCNRDEDCANDLECYRRPGEFETPIPGCGGVGDRGVDYCYEPSAVTLRLRSPFCSKRNPCDLCQGDCNSDAECGEGLACFQRSYREGTQIPGCEGIGIEGLDYCYDENSPVDKEGGGLGGCDNDADCPSIDCVYGEACLTNVCRLSTCVLVEDCGISECNPAEEFCCNSSCGMCTPLGSSCVQTACEECGDNNICKIGETCCNPDCGVCNPPGGSCPEVCNIAYWSVPNDEEAPDDIEDTREDADAAAEDNETGNSDTDYWSIGAFGEGKDEVKADCEIDDDCTESISCSLEPCPVFACRNSMCSMVQFCGENECSESEYCCNESCGICVPFENDGGCTNEFCELEIDDSRTDDLDLTPAFVECVEDRDCPIFFCASTPCAMVECRDYTCLLYIPCGKQKCIDNQICCCGNCEPPNTACDSRACQPCGNALCQTGEVCCNESCGICTAEGGFCSAEECLDAEEGK